MNVLLALLLAAGTFWFGHQAAPPVMKGSPPAAAAAAVTIPETPATVSEPAAARTVLHTHRVADGESLSVIAANYAIDMDTLLGANPEAGEIIQPGEELVILPRNGILHTVAGGETLWRLTQIHGVSLEAIKKANGKTDDRLAVGEKLFIPGARPTRGEAVSRAHGSRFAWPASGEITSPFGYRWGRLHSGIDIAADAGAPVRAARAGRILSAGWWGGYGYTVVIEHGQGLSTLYAHLADYVVGAGQYVSTGQHIGYVGDTGYSFGAHLHFEVRLGGQAVNPMQVLH